MVDPAPAERLWLQWLDSDECLPWLRGQAFIVLKQAGGLGLPPGIWPYARIESLGAEELNNALEEVAHELWLFMSESLRRRKSPLPRELAGAGTRPNLVGAYFRNGFVYDLRSRSRRKESSPYHYLYRRLREVVAKGEPFYHRLEGGGTLYSLELQGESIGRLRGLIDTDYAAWPAPMALVDEKRLAKFRADDLGKLAGFFWREATTRVGRACYLPCRELADFLTQHYQGLNPQAPAAPEANAEHSAGATVGTHPDQKALAILAEHLLTRWSPTRRWVFALALDPGNLTLQDMAARTGLSGPSHVRYHLNRACEDMADFCQSWPGEPPSPSDRGFWTEFIYCVAAACKSSLADRYEDQR